MVIKTVWKLMIENCRHDSPGVNLRPYRNLWWCLDKDAQAMVPMWSHNAEEMLVDQAEYELVAVPLTSISFVTARTIKVKRRSVLATTTKKPRKCSHGSVSTLWYTLIHLGGTGLNRGTQLNPSDANDRRAS